MGGLDCMIADPLASIKGPAQPDHYQKTTQIMSLLYCIIFCCCLFASLDGVEGVPAKSCSTLRVLHMLPESVSNELPGWHGQLESIRIAGQLAAEHINSKSSLLPDHQVEVITIPAGNCSRDGPATTIADILQVTTDPRFKCIFAVAGLSCHGMTDKVAEFLGHRNFGYVQLSSSISTVFSNISLYPYLYRVVGSTTGQNTAVIAMMAHLNWTRINIAYDLFSLSVSTASNFVRQVNSIPHFKVRGSVNSPEVLTIVSQTQSRVTYVVGSMEERLELLCDAAIHDHVWPNFVYILAEVSVSDILTYNFIPNCATNDLKRVLERQFVLRNRLSPADHEQRLFSGVSYQDYVNQLQDRVSANDKSAVSSGYANALYDQIMAFAIAMNNSVADVQIDINGSFHQIVHKTPHIRNTLAKALNNVTFQGARVWIDFNLNHEATSVVEIFQIIDGIEVLVGSFDSSSKNLTYFNVHEFPTDSFSTVPDLLPAGLGGLILGVCGVLLIVLIFSGGAMVYWREESAVKATGLSLSILILVGCVMVCLSCVFFTLLRLISFHDSVCSVLCYLFTWLFMIGLGLIMITLMFRLLRIYIFFHFPTVSSKRWRNMYLLLYIFLTMSLLVLVLFVWALVQPLEHVVQSEFISTANPPYVSTYATCESGTVWLALCFGLIAVAILVLLVLAILTRHVPYKDFKDTKKVSIFIFSGSFIFAICIPLIFVLDNLLVTYLLNSLLALAIVILCLSLIVAPKIVPVAMNKVFKYGLVRT